MKTILCLLALVLGVNAKSIAKEAAAAEQLVQDNLEAAGIDRLEATGIDDNGLKGKAVEAIGEALAIGLTLEKIEMLSEAFLTNGCKYGFPVGYDLELQEQLNRLRPVICPTLEKIKADAMATVNDVGDATKAILNAELEPVADGDEN